MIERLERAKRYHQRAVQLRAMVQDWRDPDSVQRLIEIARDYELMANDLEREAKAAGQDPR